MRSGIATGRQIGRIGNPTIDLTKKTDQHKHNREPASTPTDTGNDPANKEQKDFPGDGGSTGGKLSRLKSILTAKSIEADLEALRREGLLPPDKQVGGKPDLMHKNTGAFTNPDELAGEISGNTLPEWLRSAEFTQGEEQRGGGDGISHADLDATLGDIPEWVRKLQVKLDKRESEPIFD